MELRAAKTEITGVKTDCVCVDNADGFEAGDEVVIESQHGYGEPGIDGVWDIAQEPGYYRSVPIGKSFHASIVGIEGNALALDREPPAAAVGLTVHRNNMQAVIRALGDRRRWPDGQALAVSDPGNQYPRVYVDPSYHRYDFNDCELYAVHGGAGLRLHLMNTFPPGGPVRNKELANLTLRGNVRHAGYNFIGGMFRYEHALTIGDDNGGQCTNVTVRNVKFIDNWGALSFKQCAHCRAVDCVSYETEQLKEYVAKWHFIADISQHIEFVRCQVDANAPASGFESFNSAHVRFLECRGRNVWAAANMADGLEWIDYAVEWDNYDLGPFNPRTPVLALVNHTNRELSQPYTIRDVRVKYWEAYQGPMFPCITVQDKLTGVHIDIRNVDVRSWQGITTVEGDGRVVRSDSHNVTVGMVTGNWLPNTNSVRII